MPALASPGSSELMIDAARILTMATGEILVIDDNRQCVDAVVEVLTGEGYRVRTASNAKDALELLSHSTPGLVILDIHLPGASGLRLLSDFRRHNLATPVLMMSSEDRASLHEEAMAKGANGFLRKPFPAEVLLNAVRRFADRTLSCLI
jgi:DNA-binding NtrC family response regulator